MSESAGGGDFTLNFRATLTAIVHREDVGGFSAVVVGLPGCVTEADTIEELRANLREVVEGWLAARRDLEAMRHPAESPTP
jgi:predicted RNase H-like HicB family nuclease